eukprot:GEMP01037630.1.p1 GENE.GEMP01037630.1~~GEMP01037630.1.p1  ORF type:complete len:424 (+),score=147.03 GEMP01037630.1:253-1524(+)
MNGPGSGPRQQHLRTRSPHSVGALRSRQAYASNAKLYHSSGDNANMGSPYVFTTSASPTTRLSQLQQEAMRMPLTTNAHLNRIFRPAESKAPAESKVSAESKVKKSRKLPSPDAKNQRGRCTKSIGNKEKQAAQKIGHEPERTRSKSRREQSAPPARDLDQAAAAQVAAQAINAATARERQPKEETPLTLALPLRRTLQGRESKQEETKWMADERASTKKQEDAQRLSRGGLSSSRSEKEERKLEEEAEEKRLKAEEKRLKEEKKRLKEEEEIKRWEEDKATAWKNQDAQISLRWEKDWDSLEEKRLEREEEEFQRIKEESNKTQRWCGLWKTKRNEQMSEDEMRQEAARRVWEEEEESRKEYEMLGRSSPRLSKPPSRIGGTLPKETVTDDQLKKALAQMDFLNGKAVVKPSVDERGSLARE